ncbi:putative nuclear pore complex protein [Aspergillus heteromorphus CBS 117.55]|uniref:WD40 repeat protein poxJ n=1 Tax=Aspergillus heteromorphus CBS 117.55 TaxID=1448321 RepID=A0A317UVL1_9EURO|nr:putative nuclear pore complex protein [Aspergillus heteromorphus CBS 117.55]PWY66103.1 putative nuclear pore complex protein [Aspergillus heteromorphus CBS 117.55]
MANNQGSIAKDVSLANPPSDSISQLSWSPVANHLAVSSWDQTVRIYDVSQSVTGEGKALFNLAAPVLGCAFSPDGAKVLGGAADGSARLMDLAAGKEAQQVAAHDAPVRCVRFCGNIAVTGSWDQTVKYWDLRQDRPLATLQCQERVYAMDLCQNLLVVATADRHVHLVQLSNPGQIYQTVTSPLKHQTRTVTCIPDASGFAIGSTEGRTGFHYVDESKSSQNFTFRCHRDLAAGKTAQNVYAVNDISFHPKYYTFSTAGADGTFAFWDKDAHHRLKPFPTVGGPITSTGFNHDGSIFAYAVSYDWSKGFRYNTPEHPTRVGLHPVDDAECRPKGKNPVKR